MKEVILLVGPQGAGKTTYARKLKESSYINQDSQGKGLHKKLYFKCLNNGDTRIIVDRINHLRIQRARYADPARALGYRIKIIVFKTPKDVCLERMKNRHGHPTIAADDIETQNKAINMFYKDYEPPTMCECDELEFK